MSTTMIYETTYEGEMGEEQEVKIHFDFYKAEPMIAEGMYACPGNDSYVSMYLIERKELIGYNNLQYTEMTGDVTEDQLDLWEEQCLEFAEA